MKKAKDIVNNLANLGGVLVFCDDSDVPGRPNPNFVADIRVLCAIKMKSSKYGSIDLLELLKRHKKKELHTTEVVNPTKKSEWYGVDSKVRIDMLKHAKQLVLDNVDKIYYCQISKEQYSELRKRAEENLGPVGVGHNAGLKRVFLRILIEKLEDLQQPTALLMDQSNPIDEPRFDCSYKSNILEGGCPIITDSSVPGIQLADFVAWTITRYIRNRHKLDDEIKSFEEIALDFLAKSGDMKIIEHLLPTPLPTYCVATK